MCENYIEYHREIMSQAATQTLKFIQDQLDDIYHNGIDAWKETIKAVKDKYPKP